MSEGTTHGRGRPVAVTVAAATVVAVSLAVRCVHRGPYSPGWDFVGAAEGLYRISTEGPFEIAGDYARHGYYWAWTVWNLYAVPSTLLPGLLTAWCPWAYWSHVVTFATVLGVLAAVRAATALPWRDSGVVLLAWGASATLLSWSVTGLGYVSCVLPYALAVAVVLRLGERPVLTALAWLPIHLLSWHGQDLGQTVFVVWLAAAALLRPARRVTRAVWVVGGLAQLATVLAYPTQARFRDVAWPGPAEALAHLAALGRLALLEPAIDTPAFLALGFGAVLALRRRRAFWWTVIGAQVGLLCALALKEPGFVWPRRSLMVVGGCLFGIAACWAECGPAGRRRLLALLVAANLWQLGVTVRWARQPLGGGPGALRAFPLPYTRSTVDYSVSRPLVDWYGELLAHVRAGKKLLLLYNHWAYAEHATNPTAVLERLYLALGHERFVGSVVAFGTDVRWNHIPLHPPASAAAFPPVGTAGEWIGFRVQHPAEERPGPPGYRRQIADVEAALARRFELVWEPWRRTPGHRIDRFRLRPPGTPPDRGPAG